jgi:CubicO group peptidase (beta-lactamase class C family)
MGELDWPVKRGGAAVLSLDDERIDWRPGTGEDDRFQVASVTKLLTSLAALAAVEAGKLGLDDEPDDERVPAGATVRHLLAHASGVPAELGDVQSVRGTRGRQPGQRRVYSNAGYRILAEVVERAVGSGFGEWLGTSVLEPLGMTSTELGPYGGVGHDPAAGAVTTLPDLAMLAGCLLERGEPVVSRPLFDDAVTVQFPGLAGLVPGVGRYDPCDWGLGPELKDGKDNHWMGGARSPETFGHFGRSGCFVWVDPVAELAAVAVTDRNFDDEGWGMQVWPGWSDAL